MSPACRQRLWGFYGRWQRRIVPDLKNSQYAYVAALRRLAEGCGCWLDVGCGRQVFPPWVKVNEAKVVASAGLVIGIDCDLDSLTRNCSVRERAAADIQSLPFPSGSFDLVTANMVVEHLADPAKALGEIARVLHLRGHFLFHTCNRKHPQVRMLRLLPQKAKRALARFLEGRPESDVFPTFYRFNTVETIERLAAGVGLRVASLELMNTSADTVMLGPVVILELLAIRWLNRPGCRNWRSHLIVVLEKPAAACSAGDEPCQRLR